MWMLVVDAIGVEANGSVWGSLQASNPSQSCPLMVLC